LDECHELQKKVSSIREKEIEKQTSLEKKEKEGVLVPTSKEKTSPVVKKDKSNDANDELLHRSTSVVSTSPRKSRDTRSTLLRHISGIKGALEGFLQASS
jgi:hypothetical protein